MWIFSADPNYPKLLKELGISFDVYKGVKNGTHIPAYHLSEDTPQEKIDELKVKERERM